MNIVEMMIVSLNRKFHITSYMRGGCSCLLHSQARCGAWQVEVHESGLCALHLHTVLLGNSIIEVDFGSDCTEVKIWSQATTEANFQYIPNNGIHHNRYSAIFTALLRPAAPRILLRALPQPPALLRKQSECHICIVPQYRAEQNAGAMHCRLASWCGTGPSGNHRGIFSSDTADSAKAV
jgi:hypothetical protein